MSLTDSGPNAYIQTVMNVHLNRTSSTREGRFVIELQVKMRGELRMEIQLVHYFKVLHSLQVK